MKNKADLTARLAALSPSKRALLMSKLNQSVPPSSGHEDVIPRSEHDGPLPLSYGQEQLWFLEQLSPGTATYNMTAALRLTGDLRYEALAKAINTIVDRHEALRTTFWAKDGIPYQIISPTTTISLPVHDLQTVPEEMREEEARNLITAEASRPFDLQDILFRGKIIRLTPADHILFLNMHHIVSDGWSIGVFVKELSELYKAGLTGDPDTLPSLPIQYADYTIWQRTHLTRDVLDNQINYWQKQLAHLSPFLLTTNRPHKQQTYQGAVHNFSLSPSLSHSLAHLAKITRATLFTVLLTAYKVLLHRYTGAADIAVGSPVANRSRPELESLIGFFLNMLVLRTNLAGDPTVRELIGRVRNVTLKADIHKDVPFELVVAALQPERDGQHNPFFQVVFTLLNTPLPTLTLPNLKLAPFNFEDTTSRFDLELHMWEEPQGLAGYFIYNVDLFPRAAILRMEEHLKNLLIGFTNTPDRHISELPLLGLYEQHQLLAVWNDTSIDFPRETSLQRLFEKQVALTPNAIACITENSCLTYARLNAQANQLAHFLQHLGVQPESIVGLCLERSSDLVVSILSVVKANAVYFPLDPDQPPERIAFMLNDASVSIVITQSQWESVFKGFEGKIICLEDIGENLKQENDQNLPCWITSEALAYIMYTSGSTGQPKGIAIPHRAVSRLVLNTNYIQLTAKDRVAFASNPAFDAATFEIWGTLLNGASLVVIKKEILISSETLRQQLDTQQISTLFLTTALFNEVAKTAPDTFKNLTHLLFGGEAVSSRWVRAVLLKDPPERLLHVYGPTESVTFATWYLVTQVSEDASTVPIGRPLANTQLYILDAYLSPVPVGTIGELYIGGDGLAHGYLHQPGLTAVNFIPHPFSNKGERLYKTGDLVRYRPDGNIEFIGRQDGQIKLRGLRIELGEIETVLKQQPDIQEAVVILEETSADDKRIIAYVVSSQQDRDDLILSLNTSLRQQLPRYMIPAAFVVLDEFPLNNNGKIDRDALPPPERLSPRYKRNLSPPQTSTEKRIAQIWADVLGIDQIGIHDQFFELGGHSLKVTQVASRLQQVLGVNIPLITFFEHTTIAELAEHIQHLSAASPTPLALSPANRPDNLPLSFAQERLWFLDQLEPGNDAYHMPLVMQLNGRLDKKALESGFNDLLARHEALRTNFSTRDGQPVQIIHPPHLFSLPVTSLNHIPVAKRMKAAHQIIVEMIQSPFNLASDSLLRAQLIHLQKNEHILAVVLHHIISDGWSMGVLIRELADAYATHVRGESSSISPLPIQYADFAIWQRQQLQDGNLDQQQAYWQTQLQESTPLQLITDYPRPNVQTFQGVKVDFKVPTPVMKALKLFSQEEGNTLFITLLAAFKVLLYRYTGQSDILVGTPIANRNRLEVENLIGFFVNMLVMRTSVTSALSFRTFLKRVRSVALDAFANQDLPFEKIVDKIQVERHLNRNPLFQVVFALHNNTLPSISLPGVTVSSPPLEDTTVRFDLELHMAESEEDITGYFVYNTALFKPETINCMITHWLNLLQAICDNPDQPVSALSLLSSQEKTKLLTTWNKTATFSASQIPVQEEVEAVARQDQEQIAVVRGSDFLTYGQLVEQANQLAHHLRSHGVGPETVVAVYLHRTPTLLVALLGVLKAGAAYLPLDPDTPTARLAFMLADAGAALVLSQQSLLPHLPPEPGALCLDEDPAPWRLAPNHHPTVTVEPGHLAYVIYTSGSSGRPKGVAITHASLSNLVAWHRRTFALTRNDRATQLAGLGFDAAVWEIWPYLTLGASLYLPEEHLFQDPAAWQHWLAQHHISVSFLPTPLAEAVLAAGWQEPAGPRLLLTGGDRLHLRPAPDLPFRLINNYGPTENTVVATSGKVAPAAPGLPTIGKPIDNVQVYVLDDNLQPVPAGVPGELFIGGGGLARGYLHQPAMTAAAFIPHPFSATPGARLYRTGDRVSFQSDGSLRFLGRLDAQVKLRGFRVELGEIEATLLRHPGVTAAAVALQEATAGQKLLAAYLVPAKEDLSPAEVQAFLNRHLPAYMVPTYIVSLSQLPLTANGKVDRAALPQPVMTTTSAAPQGASETALAAIWAEVLHLPQVGRHDNFFALGGDSILAIQVIAKAAAAGLAISLKQFFQQQTVAQLAQVLGTAVAVQAEQGLISGKVPLTPIQHWFFEQNFAAAHHWNQAVLLAFDALPDEALLRQALAFLLHHHDALRLRFTVEAGAWSQRNSTDDSFAFTSVSLTHLPPDAQSEALTAACTQLQASLDLQRGPLLSAARFDLGHSARLLLVVHHLAIDAVSWRILLADFQQLYAQLQTGQPPSLPAKSTSFRYWAQQLLTYAHAEAVSDALAYWQERPSPPPLPRDFPQGSNTEASAATLSSSLSAADTDALLHQAPAAYNTQIQDVLLTALTQVFSRWCQAPGLWLALEGHGREPLFAEVDLSRTVGWFTALYPLWLSVPDRSAPEVALPAIKEQLRQVPERGLPYGLGRYLRSQAETLPPLPQPEVSFNYLGRLDHALPNDAPFRLAPESPGPSRHPDALRPYALMITGLISNGQLCMEWAYSRQQFKRETIRILAEEYQTALQTLIEHCLSPEAGNYTPSDFPHANLNQARLDTLLDNLDLD